MSDRIVSERDGKKQELSSTDRLCDPSEPQPGPANRIDGQAGAFKGQATPTADPAPDPFDPEALRLSQDFAASIGVKRVFTRIRCGKPAAHEFVRTRPGDEWRLVTCLLELKGSQDKPGQETYLVAPALRDELAGEVRPAVLFCAITRQKVPFLWRCWLPGFDGRSNPWIDTLLDAARLAEQAWVRVKAGAGEYEIIQALGDLAPPEWPDWDLREWVHLAFQDRYIASPDHPVLRTLRGEV